MKRILGVICLLFFGHITLSAQTFTDARSVLEASVQNTGGAKWDSLETMTLSGDISINSPMGEMAGTIEMNRQFPGYEALNVDLMGGMFSLRQVGTPNGGYVDTPDGTIEDSSMVGKSFAIEELDWLADSTRTLSLIEPENETHYVVASGNEKRYYDKTTLFCTKVVAEGGEEETFEDYKNIGGYWIAHKRSRSGGQSPDMVLTLKAVTLNPVFDAKTFE